MMDAAWKETEGKRGLLDVTYSNPPTVCSFDILRHDIIFVGRSLPEALGLTSLTN